MSTVLLTKIETAAIVGLHPDSLIRKSEKGEFPRVIRFGPKTQHSVRFLKSEIDAWIDEKVTERDASFPCDELMGRTAR